MRTKSSITLKHWIIILIVLLAGSSYLYKTTSADLATSTSKLKSKQTELSTITKLFNNVNTNLKTVQITNPVEAGPVLDLYTRFVYDLKEKTPAYKINVAFVKLVGYAGGDMDLASVPQSFVTTKNLKVMTVSIEGKYTEYEKLQEFLAWVKERPIAINNLSINGTSFILAVDLYGL